MERERGESQCVRGENHGARERETRRAREGEALDRRNGCQRAVESEVW